MVFALDHAEAAAEVVEVLQVGVVWGFRGLGFRV
jgi:hypothetical protein